MLVTNLFTERCLLDLSVHTQMTDRLSSSVFAVNVELITVVRMVQVKSVARTRRTALQIYC